MKRILTWAGFIIVLGLIIWGLVVANKKPINFLPAALTLSTDVNTNDWVKGSTTASITIVEYSDFQCPACAAYETPLEELIAKKGSTFKFVYRHFPLPQHANAYPAAIAAEAAGKQGKFWEMHNLLFKNQLDWAELKDASDTFTSYAKSLNLDLAKFASDVKDPALRKKIEAQFKTGEDSRIYATPTFFLNGKSIDNPRSYDEFVTVLEKAAK